MSVFEPQTFRFHVPADTAAGYYTVRITSEDELCLSVSYHAASCPRYVYAAGDGVWQDMFETGENEDESSEAVRQSADMQAGRLFQAPSFPLSVVLVLQPNRVACRPDAPFFQQDIRYLLIINDTPISCRFKVIECPGNTDFHPPNIGPIYSCLESILTGLLIKDN